ncbi:MAG: hypothetical protein ACYCVN_04120 [Acidimicrobiales bacterium]
MIASIRSEWLKLRTTAVPWVLAAIAAAVTGLLIVTVFVNGGRGPGGPGSGPGSGPGQRLGTGTVLHTTQQLRNLAGAGISADLFALLLGVLCVTTEFRHKTVTLSLLVKPHRPRMVAGKIVTTALLSIVLAVILLALTVAGGGIALAAQGGSFTNLLHQVPAVAPGMILVFALFGILGVGVGSLITNQVAALIVCLGWFLIVEQIIQGIWNGTTRWLPTGAAAAAANVTRGRGVQVALFNWWEGSLLMLAYGLAFAFLGSAILMRRDVT